MVNLVRRLGRTAAMIVATTSAFAAGDGGMALNVVDPSGKAVKGASITLYSPTQIGGEIKTVSDENGKTRVLRLLPGTFKVTVSKEGFQDKEISAVDIQSDHTTTVNVWLLPIGGNSGTVEVIGALPGVDITSVSSGSNLDQSALERLPVGRTQLAALTLVPGVVSVGGDPGLATSVNRDYKNGVNGARNNTYMVDGIDVTSPQEGQGRTGIAPELIQELDVKTGGITAEYSARAGLFMNAVTISGSNAWSAVVTAYNAPSSLQAKPGAGKPNVGERSQTDYVAVVSGPIIKDKLWFVVSGEKLKDTVNVVLNSNTTKVPGESREGVTNDESRIFMKLTGQFGRNRLAASYFRNPSSFDNGNQSNLPTNRVAKTERGGDNYLLNYTWQGDSLILDARYNYHVEKDNLVAQHSEAGPQLTLLSKGAIAPVDSLLGGSSAGTLRDYTRKDYRVDATWIGNALGGSHILKGGLQGADISINRRETFANGVLYENGVGAYSFNDYRTVIGGNSLRASASKILTAVNNKAEYSAVKSALDTNGDGTVTLAELDAYNFTAVHDASNPGLGYSAYRWIQMSDNASTPGIDSKGVYIQDQWQVGRWTFLPGFRFDQYNFKADSGVSLHKTGWNAAPRLGITFDPKGDGSSKLYAYYGRYVDPLRLNTSNFIGSRGLGIRNEQVLLAGTWVTFARRGGTEAGLVDNFQVPTTDEFRLGYTVDLSKTYTFDIVGTIRKDRNLVEDIDPDLYTSPDKLEDEARATFGMPSRSSVPLGSLTSQQQHVVNTFRGLALSPDFFAGGGFTGAQNIQRVRNGDINFIVANLPGGKRDFRSLDLSLTRKLKDKWGGQVSASLIHAEGNSLSLGTYDFQGDLSIYDPRLPYNNGKLDGSLSWACKAFGYYVWDNGLQVGVTANFNSGYYYSDSTATRGRVVESVPSIDQFDQNLMGKNKTPMQRQYDMHVQYAFNPSKGTKAEVFADVFNLTNSQRPLDLAEGVNVRPGYNPGDAYRYSEPRRVALGLRLRF